MNSYTIQHWPWKLTEKLFFHLLYLTVVNSFLLLTSRGAKMAHRQLRLALVRNLIEKAGGLHYPHRLTGVPLGLEKQASRLGVNVSIHWPVQSSRLYCHVCSVRGIKRRAQIMCKDCDIGLYIGILKPTTPNPRHDVVYKDVGSHKTTSPKRCVKENIYFACFLQGSPE
jgi:hypothetical protein